MCLTPGRAERRHLKFRGEGIWAWLVPPLAVEKRDPACYGWMNSGQRSAPVSGILQEQVRISGLVWSMEWLLLTTASGSSWMEWLKTSLKPH